MNKSLGIITIIVVFFISLAATYSVVNYQQEGTIKDSFSNYLFRISKRINDQQPQYTADHKLQEYNKLNAKSRKRGEKLPWIERGPANVGGKTKVIVPDPADSNNKSWYVGAGGAGIWYATETNDSNIVWTNLSAGIPNMNISDIVVAPSNPDIIYAATGEMFGGNNITAYGSGILKSTDKGLSWNILEATENENFAVVNGLVINNAMPDILLAATSAGIFKTNDGGANWKQVYSSNNSFIEDIDAGKMDENMIFATENSKGVLRSMDMGENWELVSQDMSPTGKRFEIAISPINETKIYCSVEIDNYKTAIYTSKDKGSTWHEIYGDYNFLERQGWYNNSLTPHPSDENKIYVAGVNISEIRLYDFYSQSKNKITAIDTINTSFIDFADFGASYLGGGMELTADTTAIDLEISDRSSIEVRFGAGLKQMAHRFTVPRDGGINGDGGSGITALEYTYRDYVEVPFQVWDTDNNRQLMISFRDQDRNGAFNLQTFNYSNNVDGREYLFVNASLYNAEKPLDAIAKTGGHRYKQIYNMWMLLAENATWQTDKLPEAKIVVTYGTKEYHDCLAEFITDAYGAHIKKNKYNTEAALGYTSISGLHPNHHALLVLPFDNNNTKMISANDGGIAISYDSGATWEHKNNRYNAAHIRSAAKKAGANEYICGINGSGTWQSPKDMEATATTNYQYKIEGEGCEMLWHSNDPNKIIGSSFNNQFSRSINAGHSWTEIDNDIIKVDAPYFSRLDMSPHHPDHIYAVSKNGVWKSPDFGYTWALSPLAKNNKWALRDNSFSNHIVRVSMANSSVVWAGEAMNDDDHNNACLFVSLDSAKTFTATSNFADKNMESFISAIATHPYDQQIAYALFSPRGQAKILRTSNYGKSWEDLSGFGTNTESSNGFPDVEVYTLLVMPHNPDIIWVGTSIGIVESTDDGSSWHLADNSFPMVPVWELKVADNQILVSTLGRGLWTVTIDDLQNKPQNYIVPPTIVSLEQNLQSQLTLTLHRKEAYDSSVVFINGVKSHLFNKNIMTDTTSTTLQAIGTAAQRIEVIAYRNNIAALSRTQTIVLWNLKPAIKDVDFVFSAQQAQFVGEGFELRTETGFNSAAIHSPHPYTDNTTISCMLLTPITITSTTATINYYDVLLAESNMPLEASYDYAVVEASTDGANWKAVAAKYDSYFSDIWITAAWAGLSANENMYLEHQINLSDSFDINDTVLLRFSLVSDPNTYNWGWVIAGKEEATALNNEVLTAELMAYPNPAKQTLYIRCDEFIGKQVEIKLHNTAGILVHAERKQYTNSLHAISVDEYPAGYYLVSVKCGVHILHKKIYIAD